MQTLVSNSADWNNNHANYEAGEVVCLGCILYNVSTTLNYLTLVTLVNVETAQFG